MSRILFLAGSARQNSINKMLAKEAYIIAKHLNIQGTFLDLADYPLPIYDEDLEDNEGLPKLAIDLKKVFIQHNKLFIASPEYNSSFSPLLKNALDWISRAHEQNEPPLSAFKGKIAAITAAAPGTLGGLRGLVPLRMMLENIDVMVTPEQLAIPSAHKVFDEAGQLTDDKKRQSLINIITSLDNASRTMS